MQKWFLKVLLLILQELRHTHYVQGVPGSASAIAKVESLEISKPWDMCIVLYLHFGFSPCNDYIEAFFSA